MTFRQQEMCSAIVVIGFGFRCSVHSQWMNSPDVESIRDKSLDKMIGKWSRWENSEIATTPSTLPSSTRLPVFFFSIFSPFHKTHDHSPGGPERLIYQLVHFFQHLLAL